MIDAVAWPAAWIALALHLPKPSGLVGPVVIALALLSAMGRAHGAAFENHRYRFTTWRWGRLALILVLIGWLMRVAVLLAA